MLDPQAVEQLPVYGEECTLWEISLYDCFWAGLRLLRMARFDPQRTYEQSESGPSTESAAGAITRDKRSEDRWDA